MKKRKKVKKGLGGILYLTVHRIDPAFNLASLWRPEVCKVERSTISRILEAIFGFKKAVHILPPRAIPFRSFTRCDVKLGVCVGLSNLDKRFQGKVTNGLKTLKVINTWFP